VEYFEMYLVLENILLIEVRISLYLVVRADE
jgi:hypothetical protein